MRANEIIKRIMSQKKIRVGTLAELTGKSPQTIYNTFYNDKHSQGNGMAFEIANELFEALGCEVVIRDKETGEEY